MNRIAIFLTSLSLFSSAAIADSVTRASQASALGGLSMVTGSLGVMASPIILVSDVLDTVVKSSTMRVEVTTATGAKEIIVLPRGIVEKTQLKKEDELAMQPAKSGALLTKNGVPLAYVVTPANANLTRSYELAH
ncbi:MAG: STM0539 family protein [Agitococcus sp.]|nr:STM0539 family protein [Agitococcus sp.]